MPCIEIATAMAMTTSLFSNPILPSLLRPCPSQPPPACSSPAAPAADHRARRRSHRAGQDKEEQERARASDRQCSGGLECSGLPPPPIPSSRLHRRPSQSNPSALLAPAGQVPISLINHTPHTPIIFIIPSHINPSPQSPYPPTPPPATPSTSRPPSSPSTILITPHHHQPLLPPPTPPPSLSS